MKLSGKLLLLVFLCLAIAIPNGKLGASESKKVSNAQLEGSFTKAQEVLYDLLLPNTMARSKAEEGKLLDAFKKTAAVFKKAPDVSVPFLASKVESTPRDDQDPAFCALQLLFEINTTSSWKVIQKAQTHPFEVVSGLAKGMVEHKEDALWGFRSQKTKNSK